MVTGDNITTATAVAQKSNIINETDLRNPNTSMHGPDFKDKVGDLMCGECSKISLDECKCGPLKVRERP